MTAVELKNALMTGPTEFSFKKKDGTIRKAYGTLNEDYLPIRTEMVSFRCTDIEWCNEDDSCSYPRKMTVKIPADRVKMANQTAKLELVGEALEAAVSGKNRPKEFNFIETEHTAKHKNEGTIIYFDLDKNAWRSFNENQLI